MNECHYDICDLLEARASSDRDAFLISKTIFRKIGTGSTAPAYPSLCQLRPTVRQLWRALRTLLAHQRMSPK
jgi:hypothetical protein